jgi:excisionase family DNA binding protein
MFDRQPAVVLARAESAGRCTLRCPWCQLLLQTRCDDDEIKQHPPAGHPTVGNRLLLTIDEAAQMLGLSRSKTYTMASTGALPVVRLGRSVRVPVDALHRWINAQVTGRPPIDDFLAS